jgi:hypothetical protein
MSYPSCIMIHVFEGLSRPLASHFSKEEVANAPVDFPH